MRGAARALRLDAETWYWLESEASWPGSVGIMLGSYLVLAAGRFGWPDFAIRATTRWMLIGTYGWLWLAGASWLIARYTAGVRRPIGSLLKLAGHVHLPLLVVGVLIQVVAVTFDVVGVVGWVALFAGAFWMPAMLVNAVAAWSELRTRTIVAGSVLVSIVWFATLGRFLWIQLAHLL